jgi:hypothetical protein
MFTSIDEMVDLTNIGTLFAFVLVCAGILVLRRREPDRPRPFKTPWGPVVPVLGALLALGADLELTVLDGDLQILVRVDAGELGAQHEGAVVLGELLELERDVQAREPAE